MKKIFLTLTLVLFVVKFGISQGLPSYIPTDGLIAYYPFNGNANDQSGNGHHGTVIGATLTSDRDGNENSSYSFDGDDIIELFNTNICNLQTSLTFSVFSLIVNHNDFSESSIIEHPNNDQFNVNLKSPNYNYGFNIKQSESGWNQTTYELNNSNNWIHISGVYDSSIRKVNLYINGVLVSNSTLNNNEFWQDPSHSKTTLGGIYQGGTGPVIQGLIGKIDDVGFWNRALTEQEIQNLYTSSTGDILLNGVVSAENNQIKNVANPTESLDAVNLGFLTEKLNELTQKINELESLIDSPQVQPPSEYVLSFDANNYVRFPNIDNYDNLDSMTIEFWAYLNSSPCTDESIIGTEYFGTGWHFYPGMWAMIGGPNNAEAMSNVDAHGSCENYIESSKWFHIALQYNSELNENQWKLYIDGNLHEQKTGNISSIGDGGDIVINRHTWDSGSSSRLSGYIDEVRFSNIARYSGNFTPEIKQLQNDENTLLLLNFENTASNQVIDSSSNQNHGIINGTVNYVLRNDIEDSNAAN